jgi:hypothetical protein
MEVVEIDAHDCEKLSRFWSQALGCIITSRARTSTALPAGVRCACARPPQAD